MSVVARLHAIANMRADGGPSLAGEAAEHIEKLEGEVEALYNALIFQSRNVVDLIKALEEHQRWTRPIQGTMDILARMEEQRQCHEAKAQGVES
jgi:hypothetical protein